ncbi:MAG TPA: twin-arginine translocase subunit TatC [Armatimonadetes bacterium]|nr:twin-arginine translocase subunit TatC [Armatimonadota bacterium]
MPDKEMEFTEHLEELRWRLVRCLGYVALGMFLSWQFYDLLSHLIQGPIERAFVSAGLEAKLVFMDLLEPLLLKLQVCLVAGVVFMSPLLFIEVWGFIAPALLPHEKRYALIVFPAAVVLFGSGVALAYFVLPIAFAFLLKFIPPGVVYYQHLTRYLYLFLRMLLAFGLVFQLPIVMSFLALLEIVSFEFLRAQRRIAIFLCFVLAAVITPTYDPINMSIVGLPLVVLFEISIWAVYFIERRRTAAKMQDQPA